MSKRNVVQELHKPARRHFIRRRVVIKGLDDLWQADLVEMIPYNRENNKHNYLLTVIDTFSKYAWAVPLKNKSASSATAAMKSIFDSSHRMPENLQTDDGKEFFNKIFQDLMRTHNINHYSTYSTLKASIVERFNRTLKEKMWREFSFNGNYKWLPILKDLLYAYNHSIHRTIKMRPIDVNKKNANDLLSSVYNRIKIAPKGKFKVSDQVRISKFKHAFAKGYTPNWSTEIFTIRKVNITNPITYLLDDFQRQPIQGSFYEPELQKTNHPDVFLVEKVLKTKGEQVYVKWLGFTSDHNSWINKRQLL